MPAATRPGPPPNVRARPRCDQRHRSCRPPCPWSIEDRDLPAPNVPVRVTAVTVLLTHPGWGPEAPTHSTAIRGGVMDSAKVNGVELEYEVVGTGEPVLLISPVLAD